MLALARPPHSGLKNNPALVAPLEVKPLVNAGALMLQTKAGPMEQIMDGESSSLSIRVKLKGADAVFLVGEFNNWSTVRTPMTSLHNGLWEITLPLFDRIHDLCFFVWEPHSLYGRLMREHEIHPEFTRNEIHK
jgi:hypothetical protein